MVQQRGVTRSQFGLGTHTPFCAAGGIMTAVGQQFVTIDTQELALGKLVRRLEFLAECTRLWIALNLPELRYSYARGIHLQCCAHR